MRLAEAEQVAQASARLGRSDQLGIQGRLARGDGGFNRGYRWHLRPETVTFAAVSIERCDGRPSYVERELDYWIDNVRSFCPWGARIVREE